MPHLLKLVALRIAILFMTALAVSAAFGQSVEEEESEILQTSSKPAESQGSVDVSATVNMIVKQTNQFRVDEGREKVQQNPRLTETAQYFADFMARTDKYGHQADGNRPSQRAKDHGYDFCLVSENIAYQYNSAGFSTEELVKGFVEGWKNSPGHRENMLDRAVMETGVAIAQSRDTGHWYAVQMFGRPKSAAIEFSISNETQATVDYSIGKKNYALPPRYTRKHTRCRKAPIEFAFPDDAGGAQQKTPAGGEEFTIVRQDGTFQIR